MLLLIGCDSELRISGVWYDDFKQRIEFTKDSAIMKANLDGDDYQMHMIWLNDSSFEFHSINDSGEPLMDTMTVRRIRHDSIVIKAFDIDHNPIPYLQLSRYK